MCGARLGVLGGTFDPPHYGHLVLAENGRVQLALDQVLFVPAGLQPLKLNNKPTCVQHRVAMVQAAISDNPAFALSRVDVDRSGPHYTVETLAFLQRSYPESELFFLMGEDSLAQLLDWQDPEGIVRRARLAVMERPGYEPDMDTLEQALPGITDQVTWLESVLLDISSSDLRARVRAGLPLRYLVPPLVAEYVQDQGLYVEDG